MTTLIRKQGELSLSKDGDHYIMEGGRYGMHSIYCPEWDNNTAGRIEAHWKGYCENNGIDAEEFTSYDEIEAQVEEQAEEELQSDSDKFSAGEYLTVWVNQGDREAEVLAVIDDQMIIEYAMPAGTTAMLRMPADGSQNWGKSISYRKCPQKWIEAIRDQFGGWDGNSQTGYVPFPEKK